MVVVRKEDDEGLRDPEVVNEEPGRVRLVSDKADPSDDYWIIDSRPEEGKQVYVGSGLDAELCYELIRRGASLERGGRGFIPISTAVLGMPAIAAYLKISTRMGSASIADRMDLNRSTIHQYLSDFAKGER